MAKMNYNNFRDIDENGNRVGPFPEEEKPKKASDTIRDYSKSCLRQADEFERLGANKTAEYFRSVAPIHLKNATELEEMGL